MTPAVSDMENAVLASHAARHEASTSGAAPKDRLHSAVATGSLGHGSSVPGSHSQHLLPPRDSFDGATIAGLPDSQGSTVRAADAAMLPVLPFPGLLQEPILQVTAWCGPACQPALLLAATSPQGASSQACLAAGTPDDLHAGGALLMPLCRCVQVAAVHTSSQEHRRQRREREAARLQRHHQAEPSADAGGPASVQESPSAATGGSGSPGATSASVAAPAVTSPAPGLLPDPSPLVVIAGAGGHVPASQPASRLASMQQEEAARGEAAGKSGNGAPSGKPASPPASKSQSSQPAARAGASSPDHEPKGAGTAAEAAESPAAPSQGGPSADVGRPGAGGTQGQQQAERLPAEAGHSETEAGQEAAAEAATEPNGQQEASSMLADPGPSKAGVTQQVATAGSSGQQGDGDCTPAWAAAEKADGAQEAAAKMAADLMSKAKGQQEAESGPAHVAHTDGDSAQEAAASDTADAPKSTEEAKSDESGTLLIFSGLHVNDSISKALSSHQVLCCCRCDHARGLRDPDSSSSQARELDVKAQKQEKEGQEKEVASFFQQSLLQQISHEMSVAKQSNYEVSTMQLLQLVDGLQGRFRVPVSFSIRFEVLGIEFVVRERHSVLAGACREGACLSIDAEMPQRAAAAIALEVLDCSLPGVIGHSIQDLSGLLSCIQAISVRCCSSTAVCHQTSRASCHRGSRADHVGKGICLA